MSHFTLVRTQLKEARFIKRGLEDMGHTVMAGGEVSGDQGKRPAEFRITTHAGGQVGFVKDGANYAVIADWYRVRDLNPDNFVKDLNQRYAYHAAREVMEQQGFDLVTEEKTTDGRIRMTLRRIA